MSRRPKHLHLLLLAILTLGAPALGEEGGHKGHEVGVDKAPQRLGVGDLLPDVSVIDGTGKSVALRSFQDDPTLFVFYMGSECTGCLKQLIELGQQSEAFAEQHAEIVGVSADGIEGVNTTLKQLKKQGIDSVTILGDPELHAIEALGTRIPNEQMSYHSVFLVDRENTIRLVARGQMAPMNMPSPAVLLLELKKMNAKGTSTG